MALADFYERSAQAASQVIAGFDAELFRKAVQDTSVGLAVGRQASGSSEGKALSDLTIRLLARFYPCLELRVSSSAEGERLKKLALQINPSIEFVRNTEVGISVGEGAARFKRTVFAGSDGWDALLSANAPQSTGSSQVVFGAGASASLAVSRIFNHLWLADSDLSGANDDRFSTLHRQTVRKPSKHLKPKWELPDDTVLVGLGAIGNAVIWALSRSPISGSIHVVDHEHLELSNLQRYVLAVRGDESKPKVAIVASQMPSRVQLHAMRWADFANEFGHKWRAVLVALDSAADRRAVQASLPFWIANAWTQPGDLGVSDHDRFDGTGACLSCLYLPDHKAPNEDEIVASALGIPERVAEVRTLLHNGSGVSRPLLEAVARGLGRSLEDVLTFEGRAVRQLYVEGICGGGIIPLGATGSTRQEFHVPLAHQSSLAGVLLAAALVRRNQQKPNETTLVTRINLMQPLGEFSTQPASKAGNGLCICEDADYLNAYRAKFGSQ